MNLRVQKILELDKIIDKVAGFAVCEKTSNHISRMKPTSSTSLCTGWLDQTDSAVVYVLTRGKVPIRPIKDIKPSVQIARAGGIIYNKELLHVKDVLHVSRCIKEHLMQFIDKEDKETFSIAEDLILSLYTNKRFEEKIGKIIVSEDEIADDASIKLRTIRKNIIREQESIKDKLNDIIRSSSSSKMLQEPIITMRQDRYVIPVKAEHKNEIKGLIHDSSASGQTYFIEPVAVLEANNRIKELMQEEAIEIERILRELSQEAADMANGLLDAADGIFKIDFMFAKAAYAISIDAIRPNINKSGNISIKKGRHPLIPKEDVVPIDFELGNEYSSVVITGPNTGGKTVTLKTVGLFILMAQAGLFIPASSGSSISLFKDVFADIGDEQSIEQSLSTFSSHMKNIAHILRRAKPSHLVLFDELGAGTDPVEGAALAVAILENMRKRKISCIATTHYSELKLYALNTKGVINASCEFDIDTLMPTYRLLIGIPGKSNAFDISKRLGLDDNIIADAKKFMSDKDMDFENTISELQRYRKEIEQDRSLAEKYRSQAEGLKGSLEKTKYEYEKKRAHILDNAKREAYEMIEKAKEEINDILDEVQNISKTKDEIQVKSKLNDLLKVHANRIQSEQQEDRSKYEGIDFDGVYKQGDKVYVKKLDTEATVISDEDDNNEVTVSVGHMKLKLNSLDLKFISKGSVIQKSEINREFKSKTIDLKTEIDIRGETVDDSLFRLDKYLDETNLAGLHQVTVIHGKGTGVLRNSVHEFLKSHHNVKSFRSGQIGEGDTGVTVVTLK